MTGKLKHCIDCRFFVQEKDLCSAPQISEFCAKLIYGTESEGATMAVSEARLNEALCSRLGYWFAPHPQ